MTETETCPKWWECVGRGPFRSTDEIARANRELGHHWFDADAMRFFGTRLSYKVYGGRFFVASHQPPHGPRVYAVHVAADNGATENVDHKTPLHESPFTLAQAHAEARRLGGLADWASSVRS